MKAALQNYQGRMRRVLDHIDRHLDGDLDHSAQSPPVDPCQTARSVEQAMPVTD